MGKIDWAPTARNFLRYIIGGAFFGSDSIGLFLSTDPMIVQIVAALIAAAVEWLYLRAKALGWTT